MPELGPGPHRSGDIADQLGKKVTTIAPARNSLMTNGMIYSRLHGDTEFTVPLLEAEKTRVLIKGRRRYRVSTFSRNALTLTYRNVDRINVNLSYPHGFT